MENAVQALKMAAAVLVFIIAITASFTTFSRAKTTADAITKSQDKQEYLESAEVDNGILYTSSTAVGTSKSDDEGIESSIPGMTTNGDRIVQPDDVISTIYRYYLEKYGVTVVKSDGTVIARFDSATEAFVQSWTEDMTGTNSKGRELEATELLHAYEEQIEYNISNIKTYVGHFYYNISLKSLYKIGDSNTFGAPWYGTDTEIIKRINADVGGTVYTINGQIYQGKGISELLNDNETTQIIEVVNEIDTSNYLEDGEVKTNLLQEFQLPTIEIVYIIK